MKADSELWMTEKPGSNMWTVLQVSWEIIKENFFERYGLWGNEIPIKYYKIETEVVHIYFDRKYFILFLFFESDL